MADRNRHQGARRREPKSQETSISRFRRDRLVRNHRPLRVSGKSSLAFDNDLRRGVSGPLTSKSLSGIRAPVSSNRWKSPTSIRSTVSRLQSCDRAEDPRPRNPRSTVGNYHRKSTTTCACSFARGGGTRSATTAARRITQQSVAANRRSNHGMGPDGSRIPRGSRRSSATRKGVVIARKLSEMKRAGFVRVVEDRTGQASTNWARESRCWNKNQRHTIEGGWLSIGLRRIRKGIEKTPVGFARSSRSSNWPGICSRLSAWKGRRTRSEIYFQPAPSRCVDCRGFRYSENRGPRDVSPSTVPATGACHGNASGEIGSIMYFDPELISLQNEGLEPSPIGADSRRGRR